MNKKSFALFKNNDHRKKRDTYYAWYTLKIVYPLLQLSERFSYILLQVFFLLQLSIYTNVITVNEDIMAFVYCN